MDSINFNIKVPLLEKAATNVKDIISHIRLNDGVYFDRSKYNKEEILNDLRSNNVQKKVEGVKRLLIAHAMKEDVSEFYVEVSNNLSNNNRTLKKLIYNYLSLYADRNTELSMLTVNSFKKDIVCKDFQIRAYALRAMCSCRSIEMISVVMDSLKIMAKDRSPYVRKTAADVVPSIYNVDPDQLVFLRNILLDLIGDREVTVVSAAVASFYTMCLGVLPHWGETTHDELAPDPGGITRGKKVDQEKFPPNRSTDEDITPTKEETPLSGVHRKNLHKWLSFLHPHYYKLCKYLLIMHPFHQTYLIDLLLRYCRMFYRDPLKNDNINFKQLLRVFGCSDWGNTEEGNKWNSHLGEDSDSPTVEFTPRGRSPSPYHAHYCTDDDWNDEQEQNQYEVDIELFIEKLLLLLSSCSYNVVIQSISSLYHLTKFTFKENMVQAIISCIMRSSVEGNDHMYALFIKSVQPIIISLRRDFAAYLSFFYVSSIDSTVKKKIKIDMLYLLSNEENRPTILEELLHALFQPGNDDLIVKKLFRHITAVAVVDSSCLSTVMQHFIALLNSNLQLYSYEAILSLRQLLRQSDAEHISQIIFFLTRIFFTIESMEVQASVLWTLAKYQNFTDHLLLFDFARMLVKRFDNMEGALKVQVLHFVLKVWAYQYASCFLHGGDTTVGDEHILERSAATTSIYQEQHSNVADGTNNQVVHHLEEFAKYERLCRLALLQGSRPQERFDIQEMSKFYTNVMLRIKELANKGDLNWTFWQRDLYKEPVSEYTLPLCYLKHVLLTTGNGDPSNVLRLSKEEMQHVSNSPFGTPQGEEDDGEGDYHFDLHHNCPDGEAPIDLKDPVVLQLNTISSILNRRLPSYVDLPDFAEEDLPKSAHITKGGKTNPPVTSISSRDVQISYSPHLSSDQIFSNVDDFYREEEVNLINGKMGCTQNTLRNAHKPMLQRTNGLLTNRGTKIQGEDDESDDEQNDVPPEVRHNSADTYPGECISATNFSKIDEQQINDIEKFFFSDEEDFERAE
ncbi:Uncharacterized protein PCOAH_00035430 [Plasmodium coatneyi]|uniref:Clathrin/coatomer adaptor adaptin-like N-terminal domain-containing protein n=1 Tax=Plasmodium coatneyi TaxID=208452 RepID=A0A1B1E2R8_9APIC|nr:Uncharacterized protein PCOAH_00035430 [Plasmodium coatneyi]ANQ09306.1 Uncharacterized protein PCOAH_00035430 [Plasmodium coatneyi]